MRTRTSASRFDFAALAAAFPFFPALAALPAFFLGGGSALAFSRAGASSWVVDLACVSDLFDRELEFEAPSEGASCWDFPGETARWLQAKPGRA